MSIFAKLTIYLYVMVVGVPALAALCFVLLMAYASGEYNE